MPVLVTMPCLGECVTEGTISRWLRAEGDRVEADEPLLEVSTDKVDTEISSPTAGLVMSIKVGEDETVDVGVELAVIGDEADIPADGSSIPITGGCGDVARDDPSAVATGPGADRTGTPAARRCLCHAAGAQTGQRAQRRPEHYSGHRCRQPHPQIRRTGRGREG